MIFDDAQIDLGIKSCAGFLRYPGALQTEHELLLVHGGRRQQSGFDAGLKPIREGAFCLYHLLYGFALMGYALRCSIAQGNDNAQLFAAVENKCSLDLALGHGNPAGVQPQLLGQEDKPLSIVAAAFLQRGALLADHCDIIPHTAEFPVVGHEAVKGSRLLCDKLDIIESCRAAIATVCDTTKLEERIAEMSEECDVTAELIRRCIEENAHISIQPETYEEKYGALVERYETAKGKLDTLQADLSERKVKRERIDAFLKELERKKELVTEFDEGLWNTMVETMTVHSYDNIVFQFRDGTKVKWQIK